MFQAAGILQNDPASNASSVSARRWDLGERRLSWAPWRISWTESWSCLSAVLETRLFELWQFGPAKRSKEIQRPVSLERSRGVGSLACHSATLSASACLSGAARRNSGLRTLRGHFATRNLRSAAPPTCEAQQAFSQHYQSPNRSGCFGVAIESERCGGGRLCSHWADFNAHAHYSAARRPSLCQL